MKLLKVLSGVAVMGLILSGTAYARPVSHTYYPPERINCFKTDVGAIRCEGFDHNFLTEDVHTAGFESKEDLFSFVSGAAYFTPDMNQVTVFFNYKNADAKTMKLKTTSVLLRPDLKQAGWTKVVDDLYVCKAGYMHCPVIDKKAS